MARLTSLLVVLWVGVTVGSVVDLQKRTVGGAPCSDTERGYHAFLTITKGTLTAYCGGSLIHEQWILTAAHCWEPGWTVKAVLGPHTDKPTTVEIELPPKPFEDKDDKGNTRQHDIMLLKLKKTTDVEPVPLPDCANKPTKTETVQIAGYYSSAQPGDEHVPGHLVTSKPLQCADIKVVKCDAFTKCLKANDPYHYQHFLCYEKVNVDTSPGDSGGGVVYNKMIYGVHVTSRVKACSGPAASIDLCKDIYMKWISETIDPKSSG